MPDRVIRDELLESDRWLALPRNTHRLGFVCALLQADALGNMEATDGRLWRLWRDPLRLDSRAAISEILESLVSVDLIRLYEEGGKRYLHIPRYRQRLRYLGRIAPQSPWTTEQEKQRVTKNSPGDRQAHTRRSPGAHHAEVEVEEKKNIYTQRKKTKIPNPFAISDRVAKWAVEHGHTRLPEHLAAFVNKATANGYRYVDWDAAFMEAIRANWANLPVRTTADDLSRGII